MRGKEVVHDQKDLHGGITPAHAGKRDREISLKDPWKDHPRPCGEKNIWPDMRGLLKGSPPPMRGKADIVIIYR